MGRQRASYEQIASAAGDTDIAVATTATVYTKSFLFLESEDYSLAYKATSDGAVKLKIELELGLVPPATEGSSDGNFVVGESFGDIVSALADEVLHIKSIAPPVALYGRLKITGLADPSGNDASTTLEAYIVRQKEN